MSGLFRRLARQAVGPAPVRLHALSRLPFVSPRPLDGVQADPVAELDDELRDGIAGTSAAAPSAPMPNHPPMPGSTVSDVPEFATSSPMAFGSPAAPISRARKRADIPERQGDDALEPEAFATEPPGVSGRPELKTRQLDGHGGPNTGPNRPRSFASEAVPPNLVAEVKAPADAHVDRIEVASEPLPPPPPPPLLQRARAEQGSARPDIGLQVDAPRGMPPLPRQRQRAEAGVPTEVQVHIGRIEVTAIQEPPAQLQLGSKPGNGRTPARSRGPEPMSLHDYLAKRGQGR